MHATASYNTVAQSCLPVGWDGNHVADLSARLADFSRMQPEQPNPWSIVLFIFLKMISAAGAKEAELQGASSVVRVNAVTEAMQGET